MPDLGISVLLKGQNFMRMLAGLGVALKISLISVVISIPLGIVLGVLMTWKNPITKAILRIYLEIVRIMPQMVLLFLVFFGTTRAFGWDLSGENASIIVFTFWGAAEMSDLVRGALISIPKHQYESSEALGLSKVQTYWYIIIPQTLRRLIPLSINLITRMIKTTRRVCIMKNGKLKKLITLATVVASTFALVACGSSSSDDSKGSDSSAKKDSGTVYRTLDEIKKDGTINIGVFSDKNPFGYVDENGEYQGYDVYFANRIGEDLGVKVNFVSTEAANRIEYLKTGKVDLILANFTVTDERAEEVDFALPYMNVALGVVSPDSNVIKSLDKWNSKDQMIVISGTTAETYLTENYPDIPLQKYDSYATAKNALENGNGVAWANDNTEVIAFALQNKGYTVGISELGNKDTIAPAVSKGNDTLLDWVNEEIKSLGDEQFFHKDYEETLVDTYGKDYEEDLVVEGGAVK